MFRLYSPTSIRVLLRLMIMVGVALLLAYRTANAVVIGPFPDFKGFRSVPFPITIETFVGLQFRIPFDGTLRIGRPDRRTFTINVPVPIFAATYIELFSTATDPFNLATDNLFVTDIWAMDLEPSLDPEIVPLMTGFDPTDPEIVPLGPEEFIGISGTVYTAGFNVVSSISDLSSLPELSGFDLSKFVGDANSLVYVSQAVIPAADFATLIPEPSSLVVFGLGLIVMVFGVARYRRAAAF